jgi:ABC-type transport system involved in cytochrome c biogenesis permease component
MKTPGRNVSIALAAGGALTFAFPIVCLPLSITAIVLASRAIKFERQDGKTTSTVLQVVRGIAIGAVVVTSLLMIAAIPGAYEANFG